VGDAPDNHMVHDMFGGGAHDTTDGRGRFVRGVSGNPLGRPAGSMNEATRIAALLLGGEAGALTRKAIDLALAGDLAALRLCLDRIIAPQREQPAAFALPELQYPAASDAANGATGNPRKARAHAPQPPSDAAPLDASAAMAALIREAASGGMTPGAAESLARVLEAQARVALMSERRTAERIAARHAEIAPRLELRVCVLMAWHIRDLHAVGGRFDADLRERCETALRLGLAAMHILATIPDTPELCEADAAFLAAHPLPLVRPAAHPVAAEMRAAQARVCAWLDRPRNRQYLDAQLAQYAAQRQAAGSTQARDFT